MTRQYLPQEPMFKRKAVQDAAERIAELEAQVAVLTARGEKLTSALRHARLSIDTGADLICHKHSTYLAPTITGILDGIDAALRTPSPDTGEPT